MKHLSALLISVVVGVACADLICVNEKSQACIQTAVKDIMPTDMSNIMKIDKCEFLKNISKCYNDAAKECKMTDNKLIKNTLDMFEELCKPGSDLNSKLEKNEQCLAGKIKEKNIAECPKVLIEAIGNIPPPLTEEDLELYTLDVASTICRVMDQVVNCAYNGIKANCGPEAEAFVRQVVNPLLEMSKGSCDEINKDGKDKKDPVTTPSMRCVSELAFPCLQDIYGAGSNACEYVDLITNCFNDAAKQFKMADDQLIKDLFNMLKELCKADSDLNKKLKEKTECVSGVAESKKWREECMTPMGNDLEKIPEPKTNTQADIEAYVTDIIKTVCRRVDQAADCTYGKVKDDCGAEADGLVRQVMKPVLAIVHQTCREVNAGVAQSASAIWLLLQLAAILFFKYIRD